MRSRRVALEALAVVIIVALLGFAAFRTLSRQAAARRASAAAGKATAVPVTTGDVVTAQLDSVLRVTGSIEPDHKAALASKIGGKVVAVTADEGQRVTTGQVLVRLDDVDIQAQVSQVRAAMQAAQAARGMAQARLDLALAGARPQERRQAEQNVAQAKAALSAAQAGLTALRKGAREQEREQAEQLVRQAKAGLDNAEANLKRAEDLYASGAVSQQQLDAARTQQQVSQAQYETAKQQLDLVRIGARPEEIQAAEDRVKQAQAALEVAQQQLSIVREGARPEDIRTAREQVNQAEAGVAQARAALQAALVMLDNTLIRSPLTGEVAQRNVDPGQAVAPGQPVMVLVDNRQVFVRAKVGEEDLRKVHPGQPVQVTADAYPGETFAGTVVDTLPAAEQETRMFEVRIRVPNPQARLKAVMFARCQIKVAQFTGTAVPRQAVLDQEGRQTVFIVRDGKAQAVPVELGVDQGDLVQVVSGVKPGDKVVVSGQHRLRNGDAVTEGGA
jgi:HlyD family secretion protein